MAMNCETFRQNIDAWLDGELTQEKKNEMREHAAACESCREELKQAEEILQMSAQLNDDLVVPLAAQAAWRKAVRAEAQKTKRPGRMWMRGMATVAAALVVLVTGTYGMRMQQSAPVFTDAASYRMQNEPVMVSQTDEYAAMNGVRAGGAVTLGAGLQSDGAIQRGNTGAVQTEATGVETVVLRSAERSIESTNYESDFQWLQDLVAEYDAYFEERSVMVPADGNGLSGRVANAVIRVPSDRLDDFLVELDQLGQTVMRSESAEDVTGDYLDTQSRLDALQMQKDKLNELLEGCENVDELIAIDDKLTEVIAEMETLTGDLRRWESQRNYSRVSITLTELVRTPSATKGPISDRMREGFDESVQWLGEFGEDALVVLASSAPKLVVWVPAIVLVAIALLAIFSRRRKG